MTERLIRVTLLLAVLALPLELTAQGPANSAQEARYRIVDLGTLSGSSASGNTINNIGWSMGSANLSGNTTEHATVWIYGLRGCLKSPAANIWLSLEFRQTQKDAEQRLFN